VHDHGVTAVRRPRIPGPILSLILGLLVAACAPPQAQRSVQPAEQPEMATAPATKPGWIFAREAVAAAHPLAAEAGALMLRAGGSAIDATVAAQAVLGLVEPQSSGIGGGAFLLHWDGRALRAYDGRETAPDAAGHTLLLDPQGRPLPFDQAVFGGRAVGVPGVLRMLEAVHRAHGRIPWARLFEPAITLAEQGFPVSGRLSRQIAGDALLPRDAASRAYFYDAQGRPWPAGTMLRNPDYAHVLGRIAREGSRVLHTGTVARRIAQAVRERAGAGAVLDEADLAGYAPRQREPMCTPWRAWRVCGMPPPSSGALAIAQILGLLERTPHGALSPVDGRPHPDFLHAYAEAARLAFADRALYVGDPDFVPPPAGRWDSLYRSTYLDGRATLIGERSMGVAAPGSPTAAPTRAAIDRTLEVPATSHLSIVDARGNAVAMTTSIEAQFGSRLMVNLAEGRAGGFLLNNQLTDFSFAAHENGVLVANRVQPGKRPRSSMAPTMVFEREGNRLVLVTGSPGGAPIIHYTAKTILGTLAWGLDAQQAVNLPNFGSLNGPTLLERGRFDGATLEALRARGHDVKEVDFPSGAQTLKRMPGGWSGGADPRRDGAVAGR
jgi:gamma-glutamyltranspeptidase/glutathione hydrolase